MAAVLAVGGALTSCSSSTPEPFEPIPTPKGSVIVGRVLIDDPSFDPSTARRPRFVPCTGLSGCARSAPGVGDYYPGANIPPTADAEVDYGVEVVLYLVSATFVGASLKDEVVHVRLTRRLTGFQMVKLDGRDVLLTIANVRFSFEDGDTVLCESGLEGCG